MASEPPRPGMVLAIDAEFVALTPVADKVGGGEASLLGGCTIPLRGGGGMGGWHPIRGERTLH